MNVKAMIIFPYGGYENNKQREYFFWWTVEQCKKVDKRPLIVLNKDTEISNCAVSFINDKRYGTLEVIKTWAVDTCQMWLTGWGYVLDNYPTVERVVQIPGDIEHIQKEEEFYLNLGKFIESTGADIAIGDFRTGDKYCEKSLVDTYGTYSLLANWFPEISKSIRSLPLYRPRSEFLNIKKEVLRKLLQNNRKFAYEQTLNFLIKSFNYNENKWKHNMSVFPLGTLSDDKSYRQYPGAIDQIERTERVLSLLWREIKEPREAHDISDEAYRNFSDEYDLLYDKSKRIMASARVTLRALLGV